MDGLISGRPFRFMVRKKNLPVIPAGAFKFVFAHLATQGVAVNSEDLGGPRLVAFQIFKYAFDEFLFKFVDGLIEQNSTLDHLPDQRFQLIFHGRTSKEPSAKGTIRDSTSAWSSNSASVRFAAEGLQIQVNPVRGR